MRVLIFVLLATCLLFADAKPGKNNKNEHKKKNKARAAGRHDKGERVWHLAESEEGCGNYSELYQSHEKPYDLCSEVNATMNICSTRDTDKVKMEEMEEEADETAAAFAEPRHHEDDDHDEDHHHHKMYTPREEAEWEFKTGTCVFRLHMEKEDSSEESSEEASDRKKNKRKGDKKNKKMTKSEMKRMQERSKLRKKLKEKKETKSPEKRSRSKSKVAKNKKQVAAEPRNEA